MSQYFINIYKGIKALLGGMSLTFKHMNQKKELVATMQYPHEKWPIPERDIGFNHDEYNLIRSRLHVDIDDGLVKTIAWIKAYNEQYQHNY